MLKNLTNKLYGLSIVLLCVLTYLLNYCATIYQCALMFILITFSMNAITAVYGQSRALKGLGCAMIISFSLLWKIPYYIDGKIINGLVLISFISLMISMCCGTTLFHKLYAQSKVVSANLLSCVVATVTDGLIMGLFFMSNNNFSFERVLDIFIKECSYKLSYGLAICAMIAVVLYILKNRPHPRSTAKLVEGF
jgi:hypothetical protein